MTVVSALLETAQCPACRSAGEPRFTQRDLQCGVEGEVGQSYCAACDLFFLSSRVPETEIASHYPDSYGPWRQVSHPAFLYQLAGALSIPRKRCRAIGRFVSGGRILDVGCGSGAFLAALDDEAWQKYGTDVELPGTAPCPGEFHSGRFDGPRLPIEAVDAITMWHVFEHLYRPRRALHNAAAMLRPGGYLFLSMPDPHSLDRHVFGKYWGGWDPPRHIATYSRRALERMLTESGFQLRAVVSDGTGVDWCLNIDLLLSSFGFRSRLRQSLTLRALFSPLAFLSNRLRCSGSTLYVACR